MSKHKFIANEFPIEELQANYKYDPDTGVICKLACGVYLPIGHKDSGGYIAIAHNKKEIKAHRMAYALYYGKWPVNELDHINRNRADNRICNLRDADRVLNNLNRGKIIKFSIDRKWNIFNSLLAGENPANIVDLELYFPYSFKNTESKIFSIFNKHLSANI